MDIYKIELTKKRIDIVDFIRGIAVINMVFYHTFYDLVYIYGKKISFFSIEKAHIWQQSICITFIIISGFSQNFSSKKYKNSIKLIILSIIITIVTYIYDKNMTIFFGIIHFLGFASFFVNLFRNLIDGINKNIGLFVSMLLFLLFRSKCILKSRIYLAIYSYLSGKKIFFPLGFPSDTFYSGDYFPIIPWIFLFLAGYYLKKVVDVNKLYKCNLSKNNIISLMGKKSLLIYMLHQVFIIAILEIIF